MQIETYEIEEVDVVTPAIESQAVELIDKLGLKGQQSLVKREEGDTVKRFPYPEMTAQDVAVYEAIFPDHTDVESYSHGIIPVRVLQVVAHARDFCPRIEVWHKKMIDPDPVLVGCEKPNQYDHGKRFLLARWGDAIRPFKVLIEDARVALKQQWTRRFEDEAAEAQDKLRRLDILINKKLAGEWMGF